MLFLCTEHKLQMALKNTKKSLKKAPKASSSSTTLPISKYKKRMEAYHINIITLSLINSKDKYALGPSLKHVDKETNFLYDLNEKQLLF